MKKESIKNHLKSYSIYDKRKTTINHAFASAIAPADNYDESVITKALIKLGQDPNDDLLCIYCGAKAETWDHLIGLVFEGNLRGFGHQIGNLIPSCKKCNSSKGGKDFKIFIKTSDNINTNPESLIETLNSYQNKYSKPINFNNFSPENEKLYKKYNEIKENIFELMKKADAIADILRKEII